ncbi:putative nuclease HARBI1 [Episyrphus balteatus]|uniref:putative nuclease HARBI1 n=1 Tax=Episyrphus balteatus TaxID=286459 RepID=UPI002485A44D|nr:putative nuclease HARBI1 [Episyrphus balteatus]
MDNNIKIVLTSVLILLETLLESSSSSSSSSDDDIIAVDFLLQEFVKKPKVENFVEDVVDKYLEEQFRQQFRIRRRTCEFLTQRFEMSSHFKKKVDCGGKQEIPDKVQILAFLWFAGNKDSYREVANLFNISTASMFNILIRLLEFFFEVSPNFIKFPATDEEKQRAAAKFKQIAGFPGVIGCIDGCYIYVRKPAGKLRSTYINRHDLLSLTLQGICDAEKRFIDVFVGSPSKIHDARIFQLSFISHDLPDICGTEYHILGDAAYSLRELMLTPYTVKPG